MKTNRRRYDWAVRQLIAISTFILLAAVQAVARVESAVASVPSVRATLEQKQWLVASPEQRVVLAERIGETGARKFATSQGWAPIMESWDKTIRQGFDQVYRDARNLIHVVEAKGGSSPLGRGYGYVQGSAEWAVKAAENVLKSPHTSEIEKQAAKAVLQAACEGRLRVHVVRTTHVLGKPMMTTVESTAEAAGKAMQLAKASVDDLAKAGVNVLDDVARSANGTARAASGSADDLARAGTDASRVGEAAGGATQAGKALRVVAKVAVPIAVALDAGVRVHEGILTEQAFAKGNITEQQREVAHARNAAGMAGGWGGAFAGGELGAYVGGTAGSFVAPGPGTTVGGIIGAIGGGIAGYWGGEQAAAAGAAWAVRQVHEAGTTLQQLGDEAWWWWAR